MSNENNNTTVDWNFDHSFARLSETLFSKVTLNPVKSPELLIFNNQLADSLGLSMEDFQNEDAVKVLAGCILPNGALPLAQAYAGHQFGHFNMLGDGRALLLGEQLTPDEERFDIQLKGSGRTPYSRGGDGRAALGPMLREYIISEAMHALGIPTTRSLAVVGTGEQVYREAALPGAILTRVASSHIRVGTFQYIAQWGTIDELKELADYAINRHYPYIAKEENRYLLFFREVMKRQAELISRWQLVGFIHGVMNTDNMTISGETIDYGPCAFMDTYDPGTVFSSIDRQGRYAYGNQPYMAGWNLARLAEAILPLLHEDEEEAVKIAQQEISSYSALYQHYWITGMRAKLGLSNEEEQDEVLIERLLKMMQEHKVDFTNTFRSLTLNELEEVQMFSTDEFKQWYKTWMERIKRQPSSKESTQQLMIKSNPMVIPRNHKVEEALDAAVERRDFTVLKRLLAVLSNPYVYSPDQEQYTKLPAPTNLPYQTFCGT